MEKRKTWAASAAVSAITLALYLAMAPSQLTWANQGTDGGDLLAAILTGGIPHPTGYPTYVLLGRLFALVPLATHYFRVALLSMLASAGACGLLCAWVMRQTAQNGKVNWVTGAFAGLALGTAPLFWSQAVIVEVYGLQSLFVVIGMWWVALLAEADGERGQWRWILGLALLSGIGLGNHVTLGLLALVWIIASWRAFRRGAPKRLLLSQVGLAAVGLLVYLYFPIQARQYPPINWGNPQTLKGIVWQITAQPYRELAFGAPLRTVVQRITAWASLLVEQFGVAGTILGVVGAINYPFKHHTVNWLLWWTVGAYTVFAIGYNAGDSQAYLLPAYVAYAAWIGVSIPLFWEAKRGTVAWGKLLALGLLAVSVARVPFTFPNVDPRQDTQAATFAEDYLNSVPPRAILVTRGDTDSFPLWYYHFGLGWRPDTAIVVLPLTQYAWYQETLRHTYTSLRFPAVQEGAAWMTLFLEMNPDRPQCYSLPDEDIPTDIAVFCNTKPGRER